MRGPVGGLATAITEHPRAPSGVAAFMSAHSETPYSTTSIEFSSGKGVVWGRSGQQLEFTLPGKDPRDTRSIYLTPYKTYGRGQDSGQGVSHWPSPRGVFWFCAAATAACGIGQYIEHRTTPTTHGGRVQLKV